MKAKKEYMVWFDLVKQTKIAVSAESAEKALDKAAREWCKMYGRPVCWSYNLDDETEVSGI